MHPKDLETYAHFCAAVHHTDELNQAIEKLLEIGVTLDINPHYIRMVLETLTLAKEEYSDGLVWSDHLMRTWTKR